MRQRYFALSLLPPIYISFLIFKSSVTGTSITVAVVGAIICSYLLIICVEKGKKLPNTNVFTPTDNTANNFSSIAEKQNVFLPPNIGKKTGKPSPFMHDIESVQVMRKAGGVGDVYVH